MTTDRNLFIVALEYTFLNPLLLGSTLFHLFLFLFSVDIYSHGHKFNKYIKQLVLLVLFHISVTKQFNIFILLYFFNIISAKPYTFFGDYYFGHLLRINLKSSEKLQSGFLKAVEHGDIYK